MRVHRVVGIRFVPTSANRSPTMRTVSTTVSFVSIVWMRPFVMRTSRTAGQGGVGGCGAGCAMTPVEIAAPAAAAQRTINLRIVIGTTLPPR